MSIKGELAGFEWIVELTLQVLLLVELRTIILELPSRKMIRVQSGMVQDGVGGEMGTWEAEVI